MKPPPGLALPRHDGLGPVSSPADEQTGLSCGSRQKEDALKRIDAALRRLESGRFGHCLYCGDPIGLKRLDEDPAIASCATCNED